MSFELELRHHWAGHLDRCRELALLMVDVDYFKAYNDCYGHVRGDETLRTVAACLDRAVRQSNAVAARYGGEEFVALLPDSDVTAAEAVAHRFQAMLAEAALPHAASMAATVVTVSIGITALRPVAGLPPETIVHAADRSLYRAKKSGRNQTVSGGSAAAAP